MGIGGGGVPPNIGDCGLRFKFASAPLGPKRPDCIKLAKRLAAGAPGRVGGVGALGIVGIGIGGMGMGIERGGIGIGRPPGIGMPAGGIGIESGAPIMWELGIDPGWNCGGKCGGGKGILGGRGMVGG